MSTVIIGGGEHVRSALKDMESASLAMSESQRCDCESFLAEVASSIKAKTADNSTP